MKPFILAQHEKDWAQLKELREQEASMISGGSSGPFDMPFEPIEGGGGSGGPGKYLTITETPNADGGDDGLDEG